MSKECFELSAYVKNHQARLERLARCRAAWAKNTILEPILLEKIRVLIDSIVGSDQFLAKFLENIEQLDGHTPKKLRQNPELVRSSDSCALQVALLVHHLRKSGLGLHYAPALGNTDATVFHWICVAAAGSISTIKQAQLVVDPTIMQIYDSSVPIPIGRRIKHMRGLSPDSITSQGVFVGSPLAYENFLVKLSSYYSYNQGEEYADFEVVDSSGETALFREFGLI